MSRYEELVKLAREAQEHRDGVITFIETFLRMFANYIEIPPECLNLFPWDVANETFQAGFTETLDVPQALHYFWSHEPEWGIGMSILLTPPNTLPRILVNCTLFVKEDDFRYTVRFGTTHPENLDLNIQSQRNAYFDSLFKLLKITCENWIYPYHPEFNHELFSSDPRYNLEFIIETNHFDKPLSERTM